MLTQSIEAFRSNPKTTYRRTIPEIFLVISIFSKEIGSTNYFGIDFDFIGYPFFIIYFLYELKPILLSRSVPWQILIYLYAATVFSILFLSLGWGGFFKQAFSILIILSANFFIIRKYDWREIFKLYVKFAYYSAIFGIIQYILSIGGIDILIKQSHRLDSFAYEPSHYAAILVPALVFSFFHLKDYKKYFAVMLTALILTFNLTGYLVFIIIISIAYVNIIYLLISIPFLYFVVFGVLKDFNENFNIRIVETLAVFKGEKAILNSTIQANGTTVSLYSNLMVAQNNIKENFLFGSGIGGHEETYYKFYKNSSFRTNYFYGLNANSGHSLAIRILSETGLLGFGLYIFTLIRNVFLLDRGIFRSISLACLSHFLSKSFKLGGYIDYGTPFFFAMIIINGINYRYNKTRNGV